MTASFDRGERVALYAGSFDPITHGHEDLIQRTFTFADRLIVAVATNVNKQPLFTVEERIDYIRDVTNNDPRVEVRAFSGLLVDFAREVGAHVNVRGLRAVSDFEYEFQMALMNRELSEDAETIFMMPAVEYTYVSSRLVKEVFRLGGDISSLVPLPVLQKLRARLAVAASL